MSVLSNIRRQLTAGRKARRRETACRNRRLTLEQLETREVPSGNGLNVVLDPGHGIGSAHVGCTGIESRVLERDVTLDMARRIRNDLQSWGFTVTLTRNDDNDVSFYSRSHTAAQVGADFFLSLHFNGLPVSLRGTEAYVKQSGNVNQQDDIRFADLVRQATLWSFSQPNDRGTRVTDNLMGILDDAALGNTVANHPTVSALLEIESISSNLDVDRFFNNADLGVRNNNRELVALYIAYGIYQAKVAMFDNARVAAPGWITATVASSSQVNLAWGDVTNETGYRIYRGDNVLLATVGANTTNFPVTGLAAGQGYAFRVEAFNAVNSASTAWQYVTLPYDRVTAPAWLNAVAVSSSQVNLTWADVTGETGYRVYRGDGALLATLGANATSYQATALAAGQTHWFRVEAFNAGSSASTGWQWVTTPYDRVTAPGWLQVWPSGNGRVNLYWGDAANETGYRIWHWENGRAVLIATVGPNTTFFQTGSYARYRYHWFLVEAFNASSNAWSAWQGLWL